MYRRLHNNMRIGVRWYFTPRSFEEKFYRSIGIRVFKKYLFTSGDLVNKAAKRRMLADSKTTTLKAYADVATVVFEVIHLAGFVLYLFLFGASEIALALNFLINVYPIMLQRYNRARIYRLLKRREG